MKIVFFILALFGCHYVVSEESPPSDSCPTEPRPTKQLLCYYRGDVPVEAIDPCLCSHLVYSPGNTTLQTDRGVLSSLSELKQKNPFLKLILSTVVQTVSLLKSEEKRLAVAEKFVLFFQEGLIDGLEFEFKWTPAKDDIKVKEFMPKFFKEIRQRLEGDSVRRKRSYEVYEEVENDWEPLRLFTSNSPALVQGYHANEVGRRGSRYRNSNGSHLLGDDATNTESVLILQVPVQSEVIAKQYDLKALSRLVDFFSVRTDNITDPETNNGVTYHHSRLMGLGDILNTDSIVDLLIGLGAERSNIIINIPSVAVSFKLQNEQLNSVRSPIIPNSQSLISYQKLCSLLSSGQWTVERDDDLTAPYAFQNFSWVAFEDKSSVEIKGKYVLLKDLAGVGIYPLDADDARGACGQGKHPLTTALRGTLTSLARKPRQVVLQSLEAELRGFPAQPLPNLQLSPFRIVRVIDQSGEVHVVREDTATEFECSRQGYYRHPRGCNRFYRCVKFNQYRDDFSVFEYDCPTGLVFDDRWEVCVWPTQASPCDGSSEIQPVPRNKFICPGEGYFTDPENCRWFFACLDHRRDGSSPTAYEFRCPFGLAFDEQRLLCNWPWLVSGCGASGSAGRGTIPASFVTSNSPLHPAATFGGVPQGPTGSDPACSTCTTSSASLRIVGKGNINNAGLEVPISSLNSPLAPSNVVNKVLVQPQLLPQGQYPSRISLPPPNTLIHGLPATPSASPTVHAPVAQFSGPSSVPVTFGAAPPRHPALSNGYSYPQPPVGISSPFFGPLQASTLSPIASQNVLRPPFRAEEYLPPPPGGYQSPSIPANQPSDVRIQSATKQSTFVGIPYLPPSPAPLRKQNDRFLSDVFNTHNSIKFGSPTAEVPVVSIPANQTTFQKDIRVQLPSFVSTTAVPPSHFRYNTFTPSASPQPSIPVFPTVSSPSTFGTGTATPKPSSPTVSVIQVIPSPSPSVASVTTATLGPLPRRIPVLAPQSEASTVSSRIEPQLPVANDQFKGYRYPQPSKGFAEIPRLEEGLSRGSTIGDDKGSSSSPVSPSQEQDKKDSQQADIDAILSQYDESLGNTIGLFYDAVDILRDSPRRGGSKSGSIVGEPGSSDAESRPAEKTLTDSGDDVKVVGLPEAQNGFGANQGRFGSRRPQNGAGSGNTGQYGVTGNVRKGPSSNYGTGARVGGKDGTSYNRGNAPLIRTNAAETLRSLADQTEPELKNTNKILVSRPAENVPTIIGKLGSGKLFDRYGPGGWRSFDETLGPEVCQREGLFRHPRNCNKFFACYWDTWKEKYTLHIFNCPVRLAYDESISACNWPFNGPSCSGDRLLIK